MSNIKVKRFESFKHKMWEKTRDPIGKIGLKLFRLGRKILKWSLYRCSWCGSDCGLSSCINSKGLRCSTLARECTDEPMGF
jgi:hypothetical protein